MREKIELGAQLTCNIAHLICYWQRNNFNSKNRSCSLLKGKLFIQYKCNEPNGTACH